MTILLNFSNVVGKLVIDKYSQSIQMKLGDKMSHLTQIINSNFHKKSVSLVLRSYNLSYREIAELMDCTVGTIQKNITRHPISPKIKLEVKSLLEMMGDE